MQLADLEKEKRNILALERVWLAKANNIPRRTPVDDDIERNRVEALKRRKNNEKKYLLQRISAFNANIVRIKTKYEDWKKFMDNDVESWKELSRNS